MKKLIARLLVLILLMTSAAFAETILADDNAAVETAVEATELEETVTAEETDADISVEPTKNPGRLSGITIGIDPGHQAHQNTQQELVSPKGNKKKAKVASGTSGRKTGIPEYMTVLDVSLLLRDALVAEGANVVMTRETNDIDISNYERAMLMNEAEADLVLRIHCNGSTDRKVHGAAMYVRKSIAYGKDIVPEPKKLLEEEYTAAKYLVDALCSETGAKNRGVTKRDTYTMNNWSTVPIILVEMGYMTNYEEDVKLNDPDYQAKLVKGMVTGICNYFDR